MITVLVALCSLLFMQLAVAAYACQDTARQLSERAAMDQAGMACAGEMAAATDQDQPGLCHAHCQSAQQSVDKTAGAASVAAASAGFVLLVAAPPPARPGPPALQAPLLSRSTPPPIAVRHCCFRI